MHSKMNRELAIRNSHQDIWLYVDLPAVEYQKARNLQTHLVPARKDKIIDSDILLILEHSPVFTLGRRVGLENLNVSQPFLKE